MILYNKRITKALIRLWVCADRSVHLLFANHLRQVFSWRDPNHVCQFCMHVSDLKFCLQCRHSKPCCYLSQFMGFRYFQCLHLYILQTYLYSLFVGLSSRPLVKRAYQKFNFLISQPKHMLWVRKRTVSMRRFFWAPKTCTKNYMSVMVEPTNAFCELVHFSSQEL